MDQKTTLITLAETLAVHQSVTHFAVSMRALGKGDFFKKLMDGGDCRTATAAKVLAFFHTNWPADLEWPADIPRPKTSKEEAA
ncbi:hypothetical protein [Pacificibacter marinus]|jgi:hypothetical protein|uniref:hypothetical protein n=1 Tax=Pacificibacter marinus TaxID=658057 RepID=UPI001C06AAD0|nr:hypothetical protein [Pacificibacter marinus]MBU2867111.1 hypothetical protein [Pacificibacter marinus]